MMSWLARITEKRAVSLGSAPPRDPVIAEWFGGRATSSGMRVTPDSAMRVSAVFACIKVLAESIASLPLMLYRRLPNEGKAKAADTPLYSVLHGRPNRWQTSFEFREMLTGHIALRGNGYAEIVPANGRAIDQLIPLHPDRVTPFADPNGTISYAYIPKEGGQRIILPGEMLHIRNMTDDGITGLSPIRLQREAVGLAMATEEHGARLFSQGTQVGGVLKHPGKLTDEASKRLRESWEARYSGLAGAHRTVVLEEGMSFEKLGMTNEDAQFLETRGYQLEEIARIFRVPLVLLQHGDKASTYASAEQFFLGFVIHTLRPWLVRWEQALARDLLPQQTDLFAEFLVEGMLRGDIGSRFKAYAIGRQWGWLSANDIRAFENMNPLPEEEGGLYLTPLNMTPADQLIQTLQEGAANA